MLGLLDRIYSHIHKHIEANAHAKKTNFYNSLTNTLLNVCAFFFDLVNGVIQTRNPIYLNIHRTENLNQRLVHSMSSFYMKKFSEGNLIERKIRVNNENGLSK